MAIDKRACSSCLRMVRARKKDGRTSWHRTAWLRGKDRKWCLGSPGCKSGRRPVTHVPLLASELEL